MDGILDFVAVHDVAIGIGGTLILMLAASVGYSRQRRDGDRSGADEPPQP